jgi:hypothetical protein
MMKSLFKLLITISTLTLLYSCDESVAPEDDGISWEHITGKIAYLKGKFLHYLDPEKRSVVNLGATNLTNIKWNNITEKITGIITTNDSTYSLEAITLDLKHSVINNALNTEYYDWLPDGRLVTISDEDKITIDGNVLLNQKFNPVFGLACSSDGEKIVISTDNIAENYLLEIDINSLSQRIVERNLNLFDPNFEQPIFTTDGAKVIYMTQIYELPDFDYNYYLKSIPNTFLGRGIDPCRTNNSNSILYTYKFSSLSKKNGIHSLDIETGNSVELIKDAHTPVWMY